MDETEYLGGISVENNDRKKRAILAFLKDFAALCESVEDSEDSPEYYDLVKKQIRQFRKKYTSLWARPFVAGLRAAVEEDISELKDPRGVQYAVFRLRECVEIMIDRCGWEEKYASVKPPPPRVNQATTVQLEQELARRRAEERKRRSADEQKAYIEARKKARQMQIVFTTLCKVVGFDFVGTIAFKSLKTGDVFGPEDFKPQNDKREE